jgi:hypothetical protein
MSLGSCRDFAAAIVPDRGCPMALPAPLETPKDSKVKIQI